MRPLDRSRSLAASAVGALALTGLVVLPTDPATAAGPGVVFVSLYNQGNDASVAYDGFDNTVALVAQRLDPAATIAFEYNADPVAGDASPGWTAITSSLNQVGDFATLDWNPDTALQGRQLAVRAVATSPSGTTYSTRRGVAIARAEWGTEAVTVGRNPGGSSIGFFKQPYVDSGRTATRAAVLGYTSASSGTAQVSWWDPDTKSLRGKVDAVVRPSELKVGIGETPGGGAFAADLDITAFGAATGDNIALAAELDTDEVHVAPLQELTIGGMDAYAQTGVAGQPTTVTISVISTGTNSPVPGAEVRRKSDGTLVGYTDARGRVYDHTTAGSLIDYYVNTTDTDAYEAGTDFTSTTSTYSPTVSDLNPVLVDGRVFDYDEYAAGDLALQLVDAFDVPVPGASVDYRVYPTGTTPPSTYQTAMSNSLGRARIAFTPQGPGGSYTLDYRLPMASEETITFTAGNAGLALTPALGKAAPGGEIGVTGAFTVAGLPLPNRRVVATYKRGIEPVPGTTADAALLDSGARRLSLTSTTDPLGVVSYVVDDRAEKPQAPETGGRLSLSTAAVSGTATTAFGVAKKGRAKVKLKGSSAGPKDKLVVKGPDSVLGEKVAFFRIVGGKLTRFKVKKLNKVGDTTLKVSDSNGNRVTTYVVKLLPSQRVKGSTSKKLKLE